MASRILPQRMKHDNKSTAGKSLIIGGSKGMGGAAILAAKSATCVGSGYTSLFTDLPKSYYLNMPEFLINPISKNLNKKNIKNSAVAIGPGLGVSVKTKKHLLRLISFQHESVVVDADALTCLSKIKKKIRLPPTWIYTPHIGELARLLNTTSNKIQSNPLKYAIQAQNKLGGVILLKGANTWIVDKTRIYLNSNGRPSLAKAGTGDVLTGLIVGLRAQGLSAFEAAWLGAFIHGQASQDFHKLGNDDLSLTPLKLIEQISKTLLKIRRKK